MLLLVAACASRRDCGGADALYVHRPDRVAGAAVWVVGRVDQPHPDAPAPRRAHRTVFAPPWDLPLQVRLCEGRRRGGVQRHASFVRRRRRAGGPLVFFVFVLSCVGAGGSGYTLGGGGIPGRVVRHGAVSATAGRRASMGGVLLCSRDGLWRCGAVGYSLLVVLQPTDAHVWGDPPPGPLALLPAIPCCPPLAPGDLQVH